MRVFVRYDGVYQDSSVLGELSTEGLTTALAGFKNTANLDIAVIKSKWNMVVRYSKTFGIYLKTFVMKADFAAWKTGLEALWKKVYTGKI